MKAYVSEAERLQDYETWVNRVVTSQSFRFYPTKSLSLRATGGIDLRNQKERGIVTNSYLNHTRATPTEEQTTGEGSISTYQRNFLGLTLELHRSPHRRAGRTVLFDYLRRAGVPHRRQKTVGPNRGRTW